MAWALFNLARLGVASTVLCPGRGLVSDLGELPVQPDARPRSINLVILFKPEVVRVKGVGALRVQPQSKRVHGNVDLVYAPVILADIRRLVRCWHRI